MPLRNRSLEMGGKPIEGVADGVEDTDAVNKGQMDTAIADEIAAAAHDPVTLAGTPDYITLSGQVITRSQIDLTADVTGVLPVVNFATGTPDGTKFVRDDGVLAAVPDSYPWTESVLASDASISTTTWTDVSSALSFAVAASTNYLVFFDLFVTGSTSGINLAVNGPSGATFYAGCHGGAGGTQAAVTAYDTTFYTGAASTNSYYVRAMVDFRNSTNAGTLALRFKLTSGTTTTYVRAGALLKYRVN